jgi:hypothetical protein
MASGFLAGRAPARVVQAFWLISWPFIVLHYGTPKPYITPAVSQKEEKSICSPVVYGASAKVLILTIALALHLHNTTLGKKEHNYNL